MAQEVPEQAEVEYLRLPGMRRRVLFQRGILPIQILPELRETGCGGITREESAGERRRRGRGSPAVLTAAGRYTRLKTAWRAREREHDED